MTSKSTVKPPVWFLIVSILALLWNLLGAAAYLAEAYMTDEIRATLPEAQRLLIENTPSWVTAMFAIGVWGGVLGCIFLIIRKKWARPVLLISVLAVIIRACYYFFGTNAAEAYDVFNAIVMPIIVIIIGLLLVMLSRSAVQKGWLK